MVSSFIPEDEVLLLYAFFFFFLFWLTIYFDFFKNIGWSLSLIKSFEV